MTFTRLRNLLTAVVCLFAGVTAQAQVELFQGSAEQYPTDNYAASSVSFKLSEVANALGTDAATLATAVTEYIEAETPNPVILYVGDAAWTAETTADNHGFWMNAEGQPVAYGEESVWYAFPTVDADNDELAFSVGQMPNVMEAGQSVSATLKLKFNGQETFFAITLNVVAKPVYDIPEPATLVEKDLNIVGEASVDVKQYPRNGTDADAITLQIGDAVAKLGLVSSDVLVDALADLLYATVFNDGDVEEGGGMKKEEVSNTSTANAPGFWLRAVENASGEKDGECSAASWSSGNNNFFVERFAYDAETGNLTGYLGQDGGVLKANEKYFTNLYLIYGDKAYRLRINLEIEEREQGNGLEGMTKVGEMVKEFEQIPTAGYEAITFTVDVDAVAEALGCNVGDFSMQALDDSDNWGGTTANNGGYWLNDAGRVISHGASAAMYIEPITANDFSSLHIGQYPNHFNAGDEWEGEIYFVNGENYYTLKAKMTIIPEEIPDQDKFKIVATRNASMQLVASTGYVGAQSTFAITPDEVAALIGTSTPDLYCDPKPEDAEEMKYVWYNYKGYHCTPDPGVWLNADGQAAGWSADNPVGICYDTTTGEFALYQYPNKNSVGDVFKANLYLVNTDGDNEWPMIQVKFTITFVSEIADYEEVGSQDLAIPVSMNGEAITVDLSPVAEALGVSVDDLMNNNNAYLKGFGSGAYGEAQNAETGLSFDANGDCVTSGDEYYFWFEKADDEITLNAGANSDVAEDLNLPIQFAFSIDSKIYVFYARLMSTAVYENYLTGIGAINAGEQARGTVYDLSGRRVSNPVRGLYIQDGKKFVVK